MEEGNCENNSQASGPARNSVIEQNNANEEEKAGNCYW